MNVSINIILCLVGLLILLIYGAIVYLTFDFVRENWNFMFDRYRPSRPQTQFCREFFVLFVALLLLFGEIIGGLMIILYIFKR